MPKRRFLPYEPPPSHVEKRRNRGLATPVPPQNVPSTQPTTDRSGRASVTTADAETIQPMTEQDEAPVSILLPSYSSCD